MSDDLLALENQVCYGLAVAARSVIALYRPVLEPLSLTHPQYLVMLALWEREPRSVKDLSEALQLEPATLSPLLKRLETTGYVERKRSTADERALEVRLTPAGRELRAEAEKIPHRIVERLGLPVSELESLRGSLHGIIAAATQAQ
ncbi:MarR family winged helix-turn-helix transcriptional regulator [Leifsonia aquatica]|uniref:DNA-binding MarR family transcriptional regulator n=2 Tax=Leifsonia aquatica TaxID=144185 RepID=A0A7W4YKA8_LEIAQ|nr:MarR family transcriptional regulator [Leifsonia aquatica]ERK70587.1 putative organic hydroperoxide resistance transcriptional regulator [Leifsonia aquatica ATCC 14665]MBB2967494.1 DNA-binding MarR family transcriptional regulator [Leifsonia aquatica]